jgi:hypothetical protein
MFFWCFVRFAHSSVRLSMCRCVATDFAVVFGAFFVVRGDYAHLSVLHIIRCASMYVGVTRLVSMNCSMVTGGNRRVLCA